MYQLHRNINRNKPAAEKIRDQEEYNEIQRELRMEAELKEKAKQLRIQNFYKSKTGKMNATTFYAIKDRQQSRNINSLTVDGRQITDPDEIVQIMQDWYRLTAEEQHVQTEHLTDFLQDNNQVAPQIQNQHKEWLEEEITQEEVEQAIGDAHEISAPGPSGQTISLFKLLFQEIPSIFTAAINQLVFNMELAADEEFEWIRERKVVYIPKKSDPQTPSDYRPLSMLEVLYKIPSRILARRLSLTLPDIIGNHQHGFMAGKGIQEPSLLVTHVIQDAQINNTSLQLASFDIEKAFDKISHDVIIQALRAYGFPEIMIQALISLTMTGWAKVEVNGKRGIIIRIRRGSGQGDPLSSVLFLIGSEPFNKALTVELRAIMYKTEERIVVGPILFADDNISPLSLRRPADIDLILAMYERYKGVSGLNVNVNKSAVLCINTSEEIKETLRNKGLSTPSTIKHLGIEIGTTVEETIQETMRKVDIKATKRRILATTPPTDVLHRVILINRALTPIYNHIFMALPVSEPEIEVLRNEILNFLWTKTSVAEPEPEPQGAASFCRSRSHNHDLISGSGSGSGSGSL